MTAIIRLFFVFGALWSTCAAQTYTISTVTSFATRIHVNSPGHLPEPRVAGGDHRVSNRMSNEVGLMLTEAGGFVIVEGARHPLSKRDSETLRQGDPLKVADKYQVWLSSDIHDRTKALVLIQAASSTDNRLLEIMELRLVSQATKEAEHAGAGQPATLPVDEPEGRDKPQPEAEGRSR